MSQKKRRKLSEAETSFDITSVLPQLSFNRSGAATNIQHDDATTNQVPSFQSQSLITSSGGLHSFEDSDNASSFASLSVKRNSVKRKNSKSKESDVFSTSGLEGIDSMVGDMATASSSSTYYPTETDDSMVSHRPVIGGSVRWSFRTDTWRPSKEEWIQAARCIQVEEKERISKFIFKKDCKSSLAGRLLMRAAVGDCLNIPYDQIHFSRSAQNKPCLQEDVLSLCGLPGFSFNVSHHGNYAVVAAEHKAPVGVDLMMVEDNMDARRKKAFFDSMQAQFTKNEWAYILSTPEDKSQIQRLYRIWCLKESYLKGLGCGLGYSLQRASFHCHTACLQIDFVVCDTVLYVDGVQQIDWCFQETMLDSKHIVATALHCTPSTTPSSSAQVAYSQSKSTKKPLDTHISKDLGYRLLCSSLHKASDKQLNDIISPDMMKCPPNTPTLLKKAKPCVFFGVDMAYKDSGKKKCEFCSKTNSTTVSRYAESRISPPQSVATSPRFTIPPPTKFSPDALFTRLSFDELMQGSIPLLPADSAYWHKFSLKMEKPGKI